MSAPNANDQRDMQFLTPAQSKTDMVEVRLREEIVSGRYRPGMPISERVLAEQSGVSRVPVREALIRLERDGLIDLRPGRGAAVKMFTTENMLSLYQARGAIEGMAARLAAERMPQHSLDSIAQRMRTESTRGRPDVEKLAALGNEFHDAVISGSRNSVLIEMAGAIGDRVTICRRMSYAGPGAPEPMLAAEEHLEICTAIEERRSSDAEQLMRDHIASWASALRQRTSGDHGSPDSALASAPRPRSNNRKGS